MPAKYIEGEWVLATSDDGAWTLETRHDDGRTETILAMRARWPSRAAESVATGMLCKAGPKMHQALLEYLRVREWGMQISASQAPSEEHIREFAERDRHLHDLVVAALAVVDGTEPQPEGTA